MKKKINKVEPTRIYIEYDTTTSGGYALEDGPWAQREDTVNTVEFIRLHREVPKNRFFYDSVELPNNDMLKMDSLYLAVVRYSTGDTFGRTTGCWHVVGVAPTYKIAELMLEEETKPSKPGDYRHYKPWEGYFESLEDTEIHKLDLV